MTFEGNQEQRPGVSRALVLETPVTPHCPLFRSRAPGPGWGRQVGLLQLSSQTDLCTLRLQRAQPTWASTPSLGVPHLSSPIQSSQISPAPQRPSSTPPL